jgi:hypothetical protein
MSALHIEPSLSHPFTRTGSAHLSRAMQETVSVKMLLP